MKKKLSWLFQIIIAAIYLQTLFYKFSGAEESIYIFSTLGIEPVGRYFAGISELVVAILLFIPSLAGLGALMSLGVIGGAILSHLFVLGIEVQGDGGWLFILACIIFVGSLFVCYFRLEETRALKNKYAPFLPFP